MIDDSNDFKIVVNGYGNYTVYDCTIENAMKLLQEAVLNCDSDIFTKLKEYNNSENYPVSTRKIYDAAKEFLLAEDGDVLQKYSVLKNGKDGAKEVKTPELSLEFITWSSQNGGSLLNLSSFVDRISSKIGTFKNKHCFLTRPILERAAKRNVLWFEDYQCIELEEMNILTANKWKDTANVSRVVSRFLNHIGEYYCNRDTSYSLAEHKKSI